MIRSMEEESLKKSARRMDVLQDLNNMYSIERMKYADMSADMSEAERRCTIDL